MAFFDVSNRLWLRQYAEETGLHVLKGSMARRR
jgi:hypothetical protein